MERAVLFGIYNTMPVDGFEVLHFYNGTTKMMEIWPDWMWRPKVQWVRHRFLDATSGYHEKPDCTVLIPRLFFFFCFVFLLLAAAWPFVTLKQSAAVLKHDSYKVTVLVSHHLMTDFQAKLFPFGILLSKAECEGQKSGNVKWLLHNDLPQT